MDTRRVLPLVTVAAISVITLFPPNRVVLLVGDGLGGVRDVSEKWFQFKAQPEISQFVPSFGERRLVSSLRSTNIVGEDGQTRFTAYEIINWNGFLVEMLVIVALSAVSWGILHGRPSWTKWKIGVSAKGQTDRIERREIPVTPCSHCSRKVPDTWTYCAHCGAVVRRAEAKPKKS